MKLPWPIRRVRRELPVPDGYLAFFPTGRCNFRCPSCEMPMLGEKRDELSLEEITRIFDGSRILKDLPLTIAGGEPFLRRDFVDMLDFLTRRNHPVFVTTNGWFINQIRRLADLPRTDLITIAVSIDGLGPTHDTIRRLGSFERATQALEIARAAGCQVRVNTVVQPENLATVEVIADHFQQLGIPQTFLPLWSFPGIAEHPLTSITYSDENIARVARWVNSQPTDAKYVLSRGEFLVRNCHAGTSSCYIAPEGDVYACISMKELAGQSIYKMGSLREMNLDFDALWTSERAWEVRQQVKSCPGCYSGCEVSHELKHALNHTVDPATLATHLKPPADLRLDAPTSNPFLTGEWFGIEAGFRWMGKQAGVRLTRPADASRLRARVNAHHPDLGRRPVTGRVVIDEQPIGDFIIRAPETADWIELVFDLSPAPAAPLAEIRLEVDRVWVPAKHGASSDRRRLGLKVQQLGFSSV